tara:strand:- start:264 stop:488 length:225 start_codon:yes stop_codon:yes gene_type:complete
MGTNMLEKFKIKTKIIGYFILFVLSVMILLFALPFSLLCWYIFDYNLLIKIEENLIDFCWEHTEALKRKLKNDK